jgi:hypothetical protein
MFVLKLSGIQMKLKIKLKAVCLKNNTIGSTTDQGMLWRYREKQGQKVVHKNVS